MTALRNHQTAVEGKIPPQAVVSPLTFSAVRHRLLLSLALAPGLTVRELAALLEWKPTTTFYRLAWLLKSGLVEQITRGPVKTGYRLSQDVVVGCVAPFVGRMGLLAEGAGWSELRKLSSELGPPSMSGRG